MEEWQKIHINKNLDELISYASCSTYFLNMLEREKILSKVDLDRLVRIFMNVNKKWHHGMANGTVFSLRSCSKTVLYHKSENTTGIYPFAIITHLHPPTETHV